VRENSSLGVAIDWAAVAAVTVIALFEVPPGADEAALDPWWSAGGALYRALREEVDFRFVAVLPEDAEPGDPPFRARAARYEVAYEHGAADGAEGVVLVNPFAVPPEADERFLAGWHAAREALAAHRGYQGTRLYRSLGAAGFRFVNVARWSSPLAFSQAVAEPGLRAEAGSLPFPSHPALYLPVQG
jgi:Antibiotic biosynthesis monooxygenase